MIASGAAQPGVTKEEIREFAAELEIDDSHVWETSAKTGANIIDLFEAVAKEFKGPEEGDPGLICPETPQADSNTSGGCSC